MKLELKDTSHGPVYLQIREQIIQRIADQTLKAGEKLPAPGELAAQLKVDRGEAQRAYFELEQAGVVEKKTSKDFLGNTKIAYIIKSGDR
jgi:GntR family transcriptional regulator